MKIILSGSTGRMGMEIKKLVDLSKKDQIVSFLNSQSLNLDKTKANIIIDFSQPEFFEKVLGMAVDKKIPLVSGTTGLTKKQIEQMKKASKKIPILWSPNMSPGIQCVRLMLKNILGLGDVEIQVEETHHINKKDAPSGTAIYLQKEIEKNLKKTLPPIRSIRQGEAFGIHKVRIQNPDEIITVQHEALGRSVFAKGALLGARWLLKQKKKKLYTMEDVFNG